MFLFSESERRKDQMDELLRTFTKVSQRQQIMIPWASRKTKQRPAKRTSHLL